MSKRKSQNLCDLIPRDKSAVKYLNRVELARETLELYGSMFLDNDIYFLCDTAGDSVVVGWGATRNKSILRLLDCLKTRLLVDCEVEMF